MNKKVFVSYARDDQHLARNTITQLCKKGWLGGDDLKSVSCLDESDEAGYTRNKIRELIQTCDLVILVWSKHAARSPWVQYEVGMAQALERPIIVAWADDAAPELPREIKENRVVRLEAEPA